MAKKNYQSNSEKQTFNLGKKLSRQLKGGEIFAFTGDLGAGKTVLIKGLAAGLGIKQIITSPTFVLMKVYRTRSKKQEARIKNLVHIDCYRIKEPQAIADIGATEYFGRPDTVTVIEWAEKIKKILPAKAIKIKIKIGRGNKREISIQK